MKVRKLHGYQYHDKEVIMQGFLRLAASFGNKSKIDSCKKPFAIPLLVVFCETKRLSIG